MFGARARAIELRARATLDCPRAALYAAIADVERYPQFVPGWSRVSVLARGEDTLSVEQTLGVGGLGLRFTTTAELSPPVAVRIEGSGGWLRRIEVDWRLAGQGERRCRAELAARIETATPWLRALLHPVLDSGGATLLGCFERRAQWLARQPDFDPDSPEIRGP